MSDLVKELRASVNLDAVHGDPQERMVCANQMARAATEIERLRARVAELEAIDYDAIARRMAQVMFETPVSYVISNIKVVDRTRELLGMEVTDHWDSPAATRAAAAAKAAGGE